MKTHQQARRVQYSCSGGVKWEDWSFLCAIMCTEKNQWSGMIQLPPTPSHFLPLIDNLSHPTPPPSCFSVATGFSLLSFIIWPAPPPTPHLSVLKHSLRPVCVPAAACVLTLMTMFQDCHLPQYTGWWGFLFSGWKCHCRCEYLFGLFQLFVRLLHL